MVLLTRTRLAACILTIAACSEGEAPTEDIESPVAVVDAAAEDAFVNSPPEVIHQDAGHAADAGRGPVDAAVVDAGAPVPLCAAATLEPGSEHTIALMQGDLERSYTLHVGTTVDPNTPAPLVVNFHGLNNSPAIQQLFSGMNALADARGLVVVYPQGLNASFHAGTCCGASARNDVDDLGFTRTVVADVSEKLCIDARRVYATGFSNGGYMSHHVGCRAADLFAAIAPIAGTNATVPCSPARAMPVFALNADTDPVVFYRDGKASVEAWVDRNGCTGEPVREAHGRSYCDVWANCAEGSEVRFCTWAFGTHLWPGSITGLSTSDMVLDFFARFTLPGDLPAEIPEHQP